MRKKPIVAFYEVERALDLRAKLFGQRHYAVGDNDN
jgi:hypothetical protein